MKLVFILVVSLIAAFMVDCRSHPGPDSKFPIIAEEREQQQTQGPFVTSEPEHSAGTPITDEPELSEERERQQTQGPFVTSEPEHSAGTPITDDSEWPTFTPGSDIEEEKELSERQHLRDFSEAEDHEDSVPAVRGMDGQSQMLIGNSSNTKAYCGWLHWCTGYYSKCCSSWGRCCSNNYPNCCNDGKCCSTTHPICCKDGGCCSKAYPVCCRKGYCCKS